MAKVYIDYSHEEVATLISKYLSDGGILHQYSMSDLVFDTTSRSHISKANRDDLKARKKYLAGQLVD